MYEGLDILRMAGGMARHSGLRQAAIARNVANADTPGYRASDLPDFTTLHAAPDADGRLRATRAGHVLGPVGADVDGGVRAVDRDVEPSPNGNTVSLEFEMSTAARVRHDHEMALGIYRTARDILRTSLGRAR